MSKSWDPRKALIEFIIKKVTGDKGKNKNQNNDQEKDQEKTNPPAREIQKSTQTKTDKCDVKVCGKTGGKSISSHTKPTGKEGGKPTGHPAKIEPKMSDENKRSIQRENESGDILADGGYKVEQNPKVPGNKDPDLLIEGKVFDVKSPSGSRARNAANEIKKAVDKKQADRIVLNLEDSDITLDAMKDQLDAWPINGLKEVIVIKNGEIIPFWP